MPLFDNLGSMLGEVTAAAAPTLISAAVAKTNMGRPRHAGAVVARQRR